MIESIELARSRWSLTEIDPIADTATSNVYRVRLPDGSRAALKILKPYGADEINGARLMEWYAGAGAARIIAIAEPMILMEWLELGRLGNVVRSGRDDEATAILCDVAQQLHRPRGAAPTGLKPLRQQFETLFASDAAMWPASHLSHVARAMAMAAALFDTVPSPIPLHGDFHHDNVVGSQRGWMAIDPKGLFGDPAYEVANVFRNPYGAGELARRPERIDRLADAFSARMGWDRRRVLQWAAVHSAISACWDHGAGNAFDWDVTMLPLLLAAVDRA